MANRSRRGHATPDEAADGGSSRYGRSAGAHGSGHQESRKTERKEKRGFEGRQGGAQSRDDRSPRGDGGTPD